MAHCVGSTGRVVAFDVDETLATEARGNLASLPWVDVRHGDASGRFDEPFDAVLVNAGVTHPLDVWLDALVPGGRMMLPLTATMVAMGSNIGKGLVLALTKQDTGDCAARVLTVVAIYSAIGLRDSEMNQRLGKAMMAGPMRWQAIARLRRDDHEADASCWLHGPVFCLSTTPASVPVPNPGAAPCA